MRILLLTLCCSIALPLAAQVPQPEEAELPLQERLEAADEAPLPDKVQQPTRPEDLPVVTIRKLDNGDRVEEYRMNGRLYEVRVTPRNGVPYALLDINGDGRLDRRDTEGNVAPVYYTLYEWN